MADGYNCVKVDPLGVDMNGNWNWNYPPLLEYDMLKIGVERVAAIREAGGDDMDIIQRINGTATSG